MSACMYACCRWKSVSPPKYTEVPDPGTSRVALYANRVTADVVPKRSCRIKVGLNPVFFRGNRNEDRDTHLGGKATQRRQTWE